MYWEQEVKDTTVQTLGKNKTTQLSNHCCITLYGSTCAGPADEAGEGYKEEHDLVVVHCSDESYDGDEQQEDAHRDDPTNDVDARHQAEPLSPCCHSDQQQPDQLKGRQGRKLTGVS